MSSDFQWQTVGPQSQRMDGRRLQAMCDTLAECGTRSLLVVRNDRIVHEWYAPGRDRTDRHYTASLAKALVGGIVVAARAGGRADVLPGLFWERLFLGAQAGDLPGRGGIASHGW